MSRMKPGVHRNTGSTDRREGRRADEVRGPRCATCGEFLVFSVEMGGIGRALQRCKCGTGPIPVRRAVPLDDRNGAAAIPRNPARHKTETVRYGPQYSKYKPFEA